MSKNKRDRDEDYEKGDYAWDETDWNAYEELVESDRKKHKHEIEKFLENLEKYDDELYGDEEDN